MDRERERCNAPEEGEERRRGWLLVKGSTSGREREREKGERGERERVDERRGGGAERVSGREGCWGGSGETEFTPSRVRQFVSDHGARKMLPVVHVTGGPPSSRSRRRATFPLGTAVSYVPGVIGDARDTGGAGRIGGSTSTARMMTMALTVLLVLVPAAYPDKISIGECRSRVLVHH